jgi:hypothetical protein
VCLCVRVSVSVSVSVCVFLCVCAGLFTLFQNFHDGLSMVNPGDVERRLSLLYCFGIFKNIIKKRHSVKEW